LSKLLLDVFYEITSVNDYLSVTRGACSLW